MAEQPCIHSYKHHIVHACWQLATSCALNNSAYWSVSGHLNNILAAEQALLTVFNLQGGPLEVYLQMNYSTYTTAW